VGWERCYVILSPFFSRLRGWPLFRLLIS
jgi:hypothetical protein